MLLPRSPTLAVSGYLGEKVAAMPAFARDVLPVMAARTVKPLLDAAFPVARAREANARIEKNDSFGSWC